MVDGIGHQWITYTTVPLHSMIVDCFTCEELIGGPEAHAGLDGRWYWTPMDHIYHCTTTLYDSRLFHL